MPRAFSHITVGVMYHPPNANNKKMADHLITSMDTIIQAHPSSGIFLVGDMNSFRDSAVKSAFSLKQIVKQATRGNRILDKVLTNMGTLYANPDILPQIGKSDHQVVLCRPQPDYQLLGTTPEYRTTRVNGHNERVLFASQLQATKWEALYKMDTCEEQFTLFSETINDLLDTYLPMKTVKVQPSDKPWVTTQYKDLIQQRQHALLSGKLEEYKYLRNRINRMSKYLRSAFYHEKVTDLKDTNCKRWWSNVNLLMGRKSKPNAMKNLANQLTDGKLKPLADLINNTFQGISNHLPKLSPTHQHPASLVPAEYIIPQTEVEKKLMAIPVKKALGPDNIPNWVFRDFAGQLSGPLCSIFNSSLRDGYIPIIWKCADVAPLPKVTPPQRLDKDLRPISLTPVVSKVMESFVHSWTWSIIKEKIDKGQFGAIKGSCTTFALIKMVNDWLSATDDSRRKNHVQIILLDYAKAFDHVNPNILLGKLADLDIPDPLLRWIENFLMDRFQRVKIGQTFSEWIEIWGTVPQGTLLGVLCFLCMINDLETNCPTVKYVDDTTIYHVTSDTGDKSLQEAVNEATDWSKCNDMRLNASKTKELLISFAKSTPDVEEITIADTKVERVDHCTLLGLQISNTLSWELHCNKVIKKANSRLFFLKQLKRAKMSPMDIVATFLSIVRPILEYACQVWHPGLTVDQHDSLEKIQERALKIAMPSLEYPEALQTCNIPTLKSRRMELCKRLFNDMQSDTHSLMTCYLFPKRRPIEPEMHTHTLCH
jgi:hypothetical protein